MSSLCHCGHEASYHRPNCHGNSGPAACPCRRFAWQRPVELEGSTQPPLPTRRAIADEMQPAIYAAIRSYVDLRTIHGVSCQAAKAAADALIARGWVRVSGETP